MEKLIELYYEYKLDILKRDMRVNGATERVIELVDIEKVEEDELEKNLNKLSELKHFIKWLVENNKIDFTKDCIIEFGYYGTEGHCDKYDNILMNLAIQDEPIEFLISILK